MSRPVRWLARVLLLIAAGVVLVMLVRVLGSGLPFVLVGYSMGGALAVDYVLEALDSSELPVPERLVLLSPAIGVSPAGILGSWHKALSWLPYFEKFRWLDILLEYDPFKYNSFPVNAGEQMYQLTLDIASRIEDLNSGSGVPGFPRVLAFQSLIDATVIPSALVNRLMRRLAPEGHELVLFDVNRVAVIDPFVRTEKEQLRDELMADAGLPFTLTLITNAGEQSRDIMARRKAPFGAKVTESPLGLAWPKGIYSLAHVALPFPPDDALYGYAAPSGSGLNLGRLEPRGEKGLLVVSASQMLRLRSNPFLPYVEQRMLDFFDLVDAK